MQKSKLKMFDRTASSHPIFLFCIILCVMLCAFSLLSAQEEEMSLSPGSKIKNFLFATFDGKGKKEPLNQYRNGKILVLSFLGKDEASKKQAKRLQELLSAYGGSRNFVVLGVLKSYDTAQVEALKKDYSLSYPLVSDLKRDVFKLYRVNHVPLTLVVDPSGHLRKILSDASQDALLLEIDFVHDNYVKPPKVKTGALKMKKEFDPKDLKINRIPELKDTKKTKEDTLKTGDVIEIRE